MQAEYKQLQAEVVELRKAVQRSEQKGGSDSTQSAHMPMSRLSWQARIKICLATCGVSFEKAQLVV